MSHHDLTVNDSRHFPSFTSIFKKTTARAKALLGVCLVACSISAQAAPLNLTQDFPDILVSDLDLAYNPVTFTFSATDSLASFFSKEPGFIAISSGSYSLSAPIDILGNLAGPGSLSILGDIGAGITTLLSGIVTQFGFSGLGIPVDPLILEFVLNVTASAAEFQLRPHRRNYHHFK